MTREEILALMNQILQRRGLAAVADGASLARESGFRSLDFSELALRLEGGLGQELHFDAAAMRRIETVTDVLDFFETVMAA